MQRHTEACAPAKGNLLNIVLFLIEAGILRGNVVAALGTPLLHAVLEFRLVNFAHDIESARVVH